MAFNFELWFAKAQFGMTERIKMYRKIMSFVKQGVPLFNTLELFGDAYEENKKGEPRSIILRQWTERISQGSTFSMSLTGYAPEAEVMLIESGEVSGDIENGFNQAIFVTESSKKIQSAIVSGLSYSLTVLLVLLGMMGMFAFYIMPQLVDVIPKENWQGSAAALYSMSMFIKDYGLYSLVGCVVFLGGSLKSMPIWTGRSREFADHLPPWSIYKIIQGAVFLISLSSLMRTGVSLKDSLIKLHDKSSFYTRAYIDKMLDKLSHGESNGESLNVGLLDGEIAMDIKLLGGVSDFDEIMLMIGTEAINVNVERISAMASRVGTLILMLTAFYTGFSYYAFYMLTSSLGN